MTTECKFVIEFEADSGYRWWTGSMPESHVSHYIDNTSDGLSDIDHAGPCVGTCSDPL